MTLHGSAFVSAGKFPGDSKVGRLISRNWDVKEVPHTGTSNWIAFGGLGRLPPGPSFSSGKGA
ncbi:MAG: hypothetical protein WAJ88_15575 [Pseudolabrys sp.]